MDILITHQDENKAEGLLSKLVERLEKLVSTLFSPQTEKLTECFSSALHLLLWSKQTFNSKNLILFVVYF